jgi:hypothetical protein
MQLDTNTHNNQTSLPTFFDTHLDFDSQINDINDELNKTDKEPSDEDVICWSLIKEQMNELSQELL